MTDKQIQMLKQAKERSVAINLILNINPDNPCSTGEYKRKKSTINHKIQEYIENHYDRINQYLGDYSNANNAVDNSTLVTSEKISDQKGFHRIVTNKKDLEYAIKEMQEELNIENKEKQNKTINDEEICYKIQTRIIAYQNALKFSDIINFPAFKN